MKAKQIVDEVHEFFADTSRSQQETLEGLEEIVAAAQMNIDALKEDMRDAE